MMTLLRLVFEFFKTGLFSIGGGLATLPFLYEMSDHTGWFTHTDIADMIAVSKSTPGAIGINMATYAGYKTSGILGGFCATVGLAMPSIIIILIVAHFLNKFRDSRYVARAFYGLRPASIAMISAAGISVVKITMFNLPAFEASHSITDLFSWKAWILGILIFIGEKKLKWHPIVFIAIAAAAGIVFHFAQ